MYYGFETKDEMLKKLRAYKENPDDDTIRIKNKIEEIFMNSPELLYALNEKELECELFDEDGNLDDTGDWSLYFGETGNIRPYMFLPDVQTDSRHYVCYKVGFRETMRYNDQMKEAIVTIVILCYGQDIYDKWTGLPRHDLLASIVREKLAWSGFMVDAAIPSSDDEGSVDNNYVMRTMTFVGKIPNSVSMTKNGVSGYMNKGKK